MFPRQGEMGEITPFTRKCTSEPSEPLTPLPHPIPTPFSPPSTPEQVFSCGNDRLSFHLNEK